MKAAKPKKKLKKILLIILVIVALFLLFTFIRHRILLKREKDIVKPIGQMVEVDGHKMCVYTEGDGDKTLVFMSGSGTISPILDFKSIYPQLTDKYRIAVVEKFGYGYSDQVDKPRDVASILADTRAALKGAGVEAPYVLCPHSYSGIEALYWAQTYPDEVESIIGLDMCVPECYDYTKDGKLAVPYYRLMHGLLNLGIGRYVSDSTLLPSGDFLTDDECKTWIALFNRNYGNISFARECKMAKDNAAVVSSKEKPKVPMLLFVSTGEGTSMQDEWRDIFYRYADGMQNIKIIELDCSHYIFHFEADRMTKEIGLFLDEKTVTQRVSEYVKRLQRQAEKSDLS